MTGDLSLQSWFEQAADGESMEYPCMRCAGLYRGLYATLGEGAADPALATTVSNTVSRLNDLLVASLFIKGNGDLSNPEAVAQVPGRIMAFAEFYAERMAGNIEATGSAFLSDDMIRSDIEFCERVSGYAADLLRKNSPQS